MILTSIIALAAVADAPAIADATPIDPSTYQVEVIATGLTNPWNMSWLPSGDMLVTERTGALRVIRDGELLNDAVTGLPEIYARGQAGLFEVELHPDFDENNLVYLTYATGTRGANTLRLARATYESTETGGALSDFEVLFTANADRDSVHHYGGRMVWQEDGTLLLTSGEGSRAKYRVKAQTLDTHFGKVLRLTEDGKPAPGNPFMDKPDALPEIWSYGHRNPQGIALGPDGTVYTNEHGPRGGDEMNIVEPGKNYGWPSITYGIDYSGAQISPLDKLSGMEQPMFQWTPSIAPSSLVYYEADDFPGWQGKLVTGALAYKRVQISDPLQPSAPQQSILSERNKRVRDVAVGPDGALYVATEDRGGDGGGEILRILPEG